MFDNWYIIYYRNPLHCQKETPEHINTHVYTHATPQLNQSKEASTLLVKEMIAKLKVMQRTISQNQTGQTFDLCS